MKLSTHFVIVMGLCFFVPTVSFRPIPRASLCIIPMNKKATRSCNMVNLNRRVEGPDTVPTPSEPFGPKGTLVEVRFHGHDLWFPAKIVLNHPDGTCAVRYKDGEIETHVNPSMIRKSSSATSYGAQQQTAAPTTTKQQLTKRKARPVAHHPANTKDMLYTVRPLFSSLTPQIISSSSPDPTITLWEFTEYFVYLWLFTAFFRMIAPVLAQ